MKSKAIKFLNSLINGETPKSEMDLIAYIRRCVREHKDIESVVAGFDWGFIFDKLWEVYPRKVGKEAARKAFEHKVRGLAEEECRKKCNVIFIRERQAIQEWVENGTETQFIPHFATWLNANVPNSEHFRGR